ncbi:MAG: ABC transporter ATP-binding protein/permease [Clostridia bacterium]|nr:ABC transporter ATP-binding protein/permease [Clostridia bacterium]
MEDKTPKVKKHVIFRLCRKFAKNAIGFFLLGILAAMLGSVIELCFPKIISFTVDTVLDGSGTVPSFLERFVSAEYLRNNLWVIAVVVLILALLLGLMKYLKQVWDRRASETLVQTMRNTLYEHITHLPFSWFVKNQTGDIIQRCTSDVGTIQSFLADQLANLLSISINILFSIFFVMSVNIKMSIITFCTLPIILLYTSLFSKKISKGFRLCDENEGKLSAICQENLTGVRVVRAFGREVYEVEKFKKQNQFYTQCWINLMRLMAMFWNFGDIVMGLQCLVILVSGVLLSVHGELSTGEFIAAVSYNSMLVWPVHHLGRIITEMNKAGISFVRVGEILDAEPEKDVPDAKECDPSGDIEFKNVSFSYDGENKVLDDISFKIKNGSTLGIIGMTGSGKSTLVQLLCRLYNVDEGCITIAGTNIADVKASSLRKSIGIVLQEPYLFSRTIKDNIQITDTDGGNEETLAKSASIACLTDTIDTFANGYDTMVGERGVTLSGGQKQRVAIARTLYQGSPIVIFDDSLSAVDAETDAKIRRAINTELKGATVIIIAHRISTLMAADNIIVLDSGKIIEHGTHDELVKAGGLYSKINDIQTKGGDQND